MPGTLSLASPTKAFCWYGGVSASACSRALTDEARFVSSQADEFDHHFHSSFSFGRERPDAISELLDVLAEHRHDGWDGHIAPALSANTVASTLAVLRHLPRELADPEFSVEPDDGSLALEWWGGYRQLLTVAISPTGRHSFIVIDGINETHGLFSSIDGRLPEHLRRVIQGMAVRRFR